MKNQTKLNLIKDKIYYSLSFEELLYIKKYISKHGYFQLCRELLNFDNIMLINKLPKPGTSYTFKSSYTSKN